MAERLTDHGTVYVASVMWRYAVRLAVQRIRRVEAPLVFQPERS